MTPSTTDSNVQASDVNPDRSGSGTEQTTSTEGSAISREDRIRLAAYAAAERRGFEPGYEVQDWVAAERAVDAESDADSSQSSAP